MKIEFEKKDIDYALLLLIFMLGFIAGYLTNSFQGAPIDTQTSPSASDQSIPGSFSPQTTNRSSQFASKSLGECSKLSEPDKTWCYTEIAEKEGDVSICRKGTNTEIKNYCLGIVGNDRSKCQELQDQKLKQLCRDSTDR